MTTQDKRAQASEKLKGIIEEALRCGAEVIELEYAGGGLEISYLVGQVGLGHVLTDRVLAKALHIDEPDEALQAIAGQYLVALDYDEDNNALVLVFSLDPQGAQGETIAVHLDSARRLVCPDARRRRKARNRSQ